MTGNRKPAFGFAICGFAVAAAIWLILTEPFILPDQIPEGMIAAARLSKEACRDKRSCRIIVGQVDVKRALRSRCRFLLSALRQRCGDREEPGRRLRSLA